MKNKKRVRKAKNTKKKAKVIKTQQDRVVIGDDQITVEEDVSSDDAEFVEEELKTGRIGFLSRWY